MPIHLPSWSWLALAAVVALYFFRARPAAPGANPSLAALATEVAALRQQVQQTQQTQQTPAITTLAPPTAPAAGDPHLALQHDIIRGILRKDGILVSPAGVETNVVEFPQRFRVVPVDTK